jgi:hypothetical protein
MIGSSSVAYIRVEEFAEEAGMTAAGNWREAHMLGALALVAALGACTTAATPYQPYLAEGAGGVHGGYSDLRLAPNRFRVKFHGNELTSRERVENYLLYRAAELTIANGYDRFAIADRRTEHDVQTYVRQPPFGSIWRPDWRYYRPGYGWDAWYPGYGGPFWADTIDMRTVEAFEAEAEIVLEKGAPSPTERQTFDARRIVAEIGPTIQLPTRR